LLLVGASLLIGMALGALLPWREIEEELLGDQAETLKDGALEMASDGYEKAKSVAQRGYEAASEILSSGKSDADAGSGTAGPVGQKTTSAIEPHAH
jgi:hypothetical protein